MKNITLLAFFLLCISVTINAQFVSMGEDPASIQWKQIKTKQFQVIYPEGFETQGQRVATILNYAYSYAIYTLKSKPRRVSVILHNFSSVSNAFAVYAPRRIEYYMCPPQNQLPQEWAEQLAIHEFRHMVQMDKMRQGVTDVLYYLFGEMAPIAVLGLYVPTWFMEGDAVCTETALSYSGRGRSPLFEAKMRTQLLQKGKYSFEKAQFGSYRDYVPNQYEFGYFMVGHTRAKYGTKLWNSAIDNVARRPLRITPFNYGIRLVTGKSKVKLYKEVMQDLTEAWKTQEEFIDPTFHEVILSNEQDYTNYECVRYIKDERYIALRHGLADYTQIVSFDRKGNETVEYTPGEMPDMILSYAADQVCWTEFRPDIRWANRSYTQIRVLDLQTKKKHTIFHRTRYFAPELSSDGKRIICAEVDFQAKNRLVLMDSRSGEIEKKIAIGNNEFIMTPRWGDDSTFVVCTTVSPLGKQLVQVNMTTGEYQYLLSNTSVDISNPTQEGEFVYFTASYSGMSDIYAYSKRDQSVKRVISSKYGANQFDIAKDGSSIIYSDYTSMGFEVAEATLNSDVWKPVPERDENVYNLGDILAEQEKGLVVSDEIKDSTFKSKKYIKLTHLFNIHSWGLLQIDATNETMNPGFSVMSQNKLSTSFFTYGYNALTQQTSLSYKYAGWFPIIEVARAYGWRTDSLMTETNEILKYTWYEDQYTQMVSLPLNFTRNKYQRVIAASAQHSYITKTMSRYSPVRFRRDTYNLISYKLAFYNFLKRAPRDLASKWGQQLELNFTHDPVMGTTAGTMISGEANLYFPGLLKHHSLQVYTGFQYKVIADYNFYDKVVYPRGYMYLVQNQDEVMSVLTSYKLPLAYPDLHCGSVLYMKRMKATLFYDYATAYTLGGNSVLQSAGVDLLADMHVLRFFTPVDVGIRAAFRKYQIAGRSYSEPFLEFIFNASIN